MGAAIIKGFELLMHHSGKHLIFISLVKPLLKYYIKGWSVWHSRWSSYLRDIHSHIRVSGVKSSRLQLYQGRQRMMVQVFLSLSPYEKPRWYFRLVVSSGPFLGVIWRVNLQRVDLFSFCPCSFSVIMILDKCTNLLQKCKKKSKTRAVRHLNKICYKIGLWSLAFI